MPFPVEKPRHTFAEYLELEWSARDKHEFHNGEILAMSGGSYEQSVIAANLIAALHLRLDGSGCRVVDSNLRVRVGAGSEYVYPDVAVICGKPQFDPQDKRRTTILNPTLILEVLSDSTEAYDRGDKFSLYRAVPSIATYVLVAQRKPSVEVFERREDGTWAFRPAIGLSSVLELGKPAVEISLGEIYREIEFSD